MDKICMCGIAGFAGVNTDPSIITSMLDVIKHRGPDHDGYCIYNNLAIGMTRLSIVDIAHGNQPMHTADGTLSIVFNGEIYNHRQLAKEYLEQGGILKTRSDTEIILALYQILGEKCLDKLRGMFCFAILDRKENSIFIARDRVGIKPLYYWYANSTLAFGSEIKSLLASGLFNAQASPAAILDYLSLRYVPGPDSLFQGVQRLAPGHWMKWQNGVIKTQCYWRPTIRDKSVLSDAELQEQFDELLKESVDLHRLGDVEHGAYLSGGLDSAAIVSTLAGNSPQNIKTFTVGFGWDGDELVAARKTAQLLGTEHHEVICNSDVLEHLPKIIWHSDEPLGDPIVLPTYMLAQEASKHVKIVLTGEGADEILAGYLFHQAVSLADRYRQWMPDILHKIAVRPAVNLMPVSLLNKGFNYPGYLGNSGKQRLLSFLDHARNDNPAGLLKFFISLFDPKEKNQLLTPDFVATAEQTSSITLNAQLKGGALDKLLMLQYIDWLPDNILMRQDKMSMAHGLEARVPFLDHKLIEFMETVPDHLKLKLRQNKILLRKYTAKSAAPEVAYRKKSAFYFPMEEYFKTKPFQELLANTLSEQTIKKRGMLQYSAVQGLIGKMKNKDFLASKQVFALISLELWSQIFIDKAIKF